MHLYFADIGFLTRLNHDINYGSNKILNSYAMKEHVIQSVKRKEAINPKLILFLDSGAFTAWSKGKEVNLDEYISFIKSFKENTFEIIANLDKIPGKPGVPETPQDLEDSAQVGWNNLMYMNSKGINPLHIFHQGEDFKWLKKVSEHQDYIGISPNNLAPTQEKIRWLDRVFEFLSDGKGGCRNKTHGFGVSAISLLVRYSWFSCDSSSWSMGRRTGSIRIFMPENKEIFTTAFIVSDKVADNARLHYDMLPPDTKKILDKYFEKNNMDLVKMRTTYEERDKANIFFFLELEKYLTEINPKFYPTWRDLF